MLLHLAQVVLIYTLPFLAVLTLVVTVHELGHYLVARWCGVAVDRFSIGFGRSIASWRAKSGTEWRIGWIPLGGYVRFVGDENAASVPDEEDLAELRRKVLAKDGPQALKRLFHFKPLWQRALVVAAGPAANFVLAIAIYAALLMAIGEDTVAARIATVKPNTPAARAGFQPGDLIKSVDGQVIDDFEDLTIYVRLRAEQRMAFEVERAGRIVSLIATPSRQAVDNGLPGPKFIGGYLGLGPSSNPADYKHHRYDLLTAIPHAVHLTGQRLGLTFTYLQRVFSGHESGDQLSGPIGMAGMTGIIASESVKAAPDLGALFLNMISMAAFISVGVGFANLLPIPVLDGGHLLFYGYEAVARRPISANVQAAGYRVGFALLIGLMLFATWNDLQRFRVLQFLSGLFS